MEMNYIFFAFFAATCFAFSMVINKLTSKHSIDNTDSMMAYFMLTTFTFGLFMIPFVPLTIPSMESMILMAVVVGTFLTGYYLFFAGIFMTDASSYAPLFQMQAGFIGILAFLFLGERFPLANYLWMILLIIGTMLVSYHEKMSVKTFMNKGIIFILVMQVLHAISNLYIGFVLRIATPLQVQFWEYISMGIIGIFFVLFRRPKMNYKLNQITPMFLSSYISGFGVLGLLSAFAVNLTVSSVIGLLSAPLVFVVSILASKFTPSLLEHHPMKVYIVRGIGLLIILAGAYKITVG